MTMTMSGTSGLVFPDSTTQATAPTGVGVEQTWQNVLASRALSTTYTNATGKPIMVYVMTTGAGSTISVSGVVACGSSNYNNIPLTTIVPNGATYRVSGGGGLAAWAELR